MAINKVIYGGNTLIDLTGDSVTAADVKAGVVFHLPSGEEAEGTCTHDSDTSSDTAAVAEVLNGKTFHARGSGLTGTMPNNGAVSGSIGAKAEQYTVPIGYHDGSGKVGISATEQAKLIPANIKSGVTILGVEGSYAGEAAKVQANKTVSPGTAQSVVLPDSGYDYLAQVTVSAISYVETNNAAGGKTVTIG